MIAALPFVTILTLIWLHIEQQPQEKIASHAWYTFWYVLPTLPMFLAFPALLSRFGFWLALLAGGGEEQVMDAVRGHFRPEFLNRLDEIILFHRLGQAHMGPIVDIQVCRVGKLLADRKIALDLTDAARAWLGRVGYDPVYGARPLKRAVQRYLQDPLADLILRGDVKDGATVKVDEGDGMLVSLEKSNCVAPNGCGVRKSLTA